ncbi:MAG: AbrB/MazE/SpoVT family DNA-binding domain-containing protein [Bacillota bacterium]
MTVVTVSTKGQIIIPAEIRKRYNIKRGDRLALQEVDGRLVLVPLEEKPFVGLYGALKGKKSLTLALREEHAAEIAQEEK